VHRQIFDAKNKEINTNDGRKKAVSAAKVTGRAFPGKHPATGKVKGPRIASPSIENKNKLGSSPSTGGPATCEAAIRSHLLSGKSEYQCDPERISKWAARIFTKQTLA
jgi:hypothetical protein